MPVHTAPLHGALVAGGRLLSLEGRFAPDGRRWHTGSTRTGFDPERKLLEPVEQTFLQRRALPACAGNRVETATLDIMGPVHPRVCGEQRWARCPCQAYTGSSPRVRGTVDALDILLIIQRFIPAWAGEPQGCRAGSPPRRVYPRVGGGTQKTLILDQGMKGLSPRGRGNHRRAADCAVTIGSIPAWAGEPASLWRRARAVRVYPRVGGGTSYP